MSGPRPTDGAGGVDREIPCGKGSVSGRLGSSACGRGPAVGGPAAATSGAHTCRGAASLVSVGRMGRQLSRRTSHVTRSRILVPIAMDICHGAEGGFGSTGVTLATTQRQRRE